ncbi:nitrate reductase [Sphingomonas sp. SUN039]|uniref:nitrate reductase n=1 Tax=Sphingomonas sp. SUN039 TaxID=2937787 RepID=UPI00216421CE|nr:nitrate reductase [Sphingomonas sp. SUN039]UVO55762.1 molybdopterin-dependent oxidoreductase [Sphingomonas sp. SUN039]
MRVSVKTTCAYCGVGCGIVATPTGERNATIAGDPDHPANRGRLCSKGTHLGETIGLEGRLLHPMIGSERVGWPEALDLVASRFAKTIAEHGPDSVAFYVSGQLLTEDYYVANKLMKGFIGSANIDTNSRLCMSSAVAAHVRAFGEDVVPCSYSDLDEADLIVLVGSNTAWCHPVVWQQIEAAREKRGTKLVVIDPRRTETAERADLHLAIAPDSDIALWTGLLRELRTGFRLDGGFMAGRVSVPKDFWSTLPDLDVAKACDIPRADLQAFYDLFIDHPRTVTLFSQGVNQSTSGTDKANAILNVHLATGRIGKPGAGPFSITGQPNAMGGREVGGLATMLAAHMGFSEAERDRAQRFWQSPTICPGPGLKAVEMFDAMARGKIKAVWIMATNPAVSMPDARMARVALANCPFVVVSDCIAATDTGRYAQVRLPALGWGEKDGTVTNSERMVSRQRGFLGTPGDAKPDWWIIAEVAKRMGWGEAFDYAHQSEIFGEFAAQTRFENDGARVLSLPSFPRRREPNSPSQRQELGSRLRGNDEDWYDDLIPFQWGGTSPFADHAFPTPDGRANLVPVAFTPRADSTRQFALRLNTGRYRDQWHTMTRTGLSPKLSQHRREPLVEVHPDTVQRLGLTDGGLAKVETAHGHSIFRVESTPNQRRQELFVPIHWTDQTSGGGRAGLLPGQDRDPVSGQPGFKNTPVRIAPWRPDWTGFLVTTDLPVLPDCEYWTRVRCAQGWLIEVAGNGDAAALSQLLPAGDRLEMSDPKRGTIRAAVRSGGRLDAALFVSRGGGLPPRDWLIAQLGGSDAAPNELLAGRPAAPAPDRGPIVCVCFDVGMRTILGAIAERALASVEAVGAALGAGTNCGSCRPAIARMLEDHKEAVHA